MTDTRTQFPKDFDAMLAAGLRRAREERAATFHRFISDGLRRLRG